MAVEGMCRVVIGDGDTLISVEDVARLTSGENKPIRLRTLGWDKVSFDRVSYLV